jgi:hypothetical protein
MNRHSERSEDLLWIVEQKHNLWTLYSQRIFRYTQDDGMCVELYKWKFHVIFVLKTYNPTASFFLSPALNTNRARIHSTTHQTNPIMKVCTISA